MTKTIAMAGKGGTGKTTVAALLIKLLSQKGLVLAVDADPSTNLNLALGLSSPWVYGIFSPMPPVPVVPIFR